MRYPSRKKTFVRRYPWPFAGVNAAQNRHFALDNQGIIPHPLRP